jgi:hypothetical protein
MATKASLRATNHPILCDAILSSLSQNLQSNHQRHQVSVVLPNLQMVFLSKNKPESQRYDLQGNERLMAMSTITRDADAAWPTDACNESSSGLYDSPLLWCQHFRMVLLRYPQMKGRKYVSSSS